MSDNHSLLPTRREAVTGLGAAAATALVTSGAAHGQGAPPAQVTGVVFEDRSGTGRRQNDDAGLPGILVSNGREVARTDESGRYTLPFEGDGIVFVIKPAGYAVPLDENNLPRFSYVHQPGGTPPELDLRFQGIASTGPLPAAVDFGLVRTEEPSRFDVVLFTDPQPESQAELDFVRDTAIRSAAGIGAAFGMTTGDIMFDDLSFYPRYNRLIGQIGVPWWHIGGNHDLNFEAPDSTRSRETFKGVYGAPYYAFHYGQALFLMLDNVHYLGAGTAKIPGQSGRYEGRIGERQLAFVENVLRDTPPDRLVVVAMHIPLVTDIEPSDPAQNTTDREDLIRLLDGRPVLSLSGHTHTTEHHYLGPTGDHHHHVMTAVSGSWWSGPYDRSGIACADSRDGTPNGYHVLSVDGNRYTTRFVPLGETRERAMRIMLESQFHALNPEVARDYRLEQLLGSPIAAEAVHATNLLVNVFDGGPKTDVSCSLDGRDAFALKRTRRIDPFVEQIYVRNAATKKPWVKAQPSTHVWSARLPADLGSGTHRAEVRVSDEYGREHRDHVVIEILDGVRPARQPT